MILPVFNAATTLPDTLSSIAAEFALTPEINWHVIAVDDGSITINENSAEVGLTELIKTGVYTVNYTLISDTEDPLTGSYTFMFNAPSSLGTPDPAPTTGNTIQVDRNLNGGSNAFVYTLLVLAAFVFIFLIWYAKQSFGGQRKPKRK